MTDQISEKPAVVTEPEGVSFFSIRTGETHYGKLEPTIQAYINSSDMGINASRDQDYGWRLSKEWVEKVRAFKRDRLQMQILTSKQDGRKPTTTNILYYIYGEQLANYYESLEEHENPFEDAYLASISQGNAPAIAAAQSGMPQALADFRAIDEDDSISDLVDEDDLEPADEPVATAEPPTAENSTPVDSAPVAPPLAPELPPEEPDQTDTPPTAPVV